MAAVRLQETLCGQSHGRTQFGHAQWLKERGLEANSAHSTGTERRLMQLAYTSSVKRDEDVDCLFLSSLRLAEAVTSSAEPRFIKLSNVD